MNKLIGKTIVGMKISAEKDALLFEVEGGGQLMAIVDGDCCSTSWVEAVELPALGFPFTITAVENLELNKDGVWNEDGYEFVQFYGSKVSTDKGDMVIDYRNESNGYYGGDIHWPGEGYYNEYLPHRYQWSELKDAG